MTVAELNARLRAGYDRVPRSTRGMLFMLVSTVWFIAMHLSIRLLGDGLHPFEIAFFRNFFGLFVILPVFLKSGFRLLRTQNLGLHALRGGLNAIAMLAFFTSLTLAPLAQVTALSFTAPLFATVGAMLFLGEVVRLRRWVALIIGFVGALVILRPGMVEISLGPMLVLFSSAVWACALLIIKRLSATDSSFTITAYMILFLTPLTGLAALPFWQWPTSDQLVWLVAIGVLGTVAQTLMNQSFREADVSIVLPLEFCKLIWAALFGYLLLAEVPDLWTWLGGAMIFAGVAYIGIRESRLKDSA